MTTVKTLGDGSKAAPEGVPSEFEHCLLMAAREFGEDMSLSRLRSHQSGVTAPEGLAALMALAEASGFLVALGDASLEALDAGLFPVIVTGSDGRAVLVRECRGDQLVVFDPSLLKDEFGLVRLVDLRRSLQGPVLIVRRRHRPSDEGTVAEAGEHWFWSTLLKSKWSYTQVLLAAAISNVLALSTSIFMMVVYDRVLPNQAIESLMALTIGVGIALVFDFIIRSIRAGFIDRAGQRADLIMGRLVFDRLLDMQMRVRRGSTGAIANTMREFETLRDFITSATLVGVVDLPFVALFIFVISVIGGPLALVPALAVPLVLIVGLAVQPILSRMADKSQSEGQNKQSVLVETLSGLETIKTVGAARVMRERWETALAHQSQFSSRSRAATQFAMNATAFAQQAAQVMIVFYGVFLVSAGMVSMGALIACVILTGRTLAPLAQLAQTLTRFSQARASYRSLNAIMQQPVDHERGRRWLARDYLSGKIEFREVSFTYPDQKSPSLRNVSFTIEPGEKVAILGKIGSGKSTVARLINGLYTANDGQVLLDNTDVSHIAPSDLRHNIGCVLQDVWLFSGTVHDNIAVGADRPSDTSILEAARRTGVHEFVSRHPLGYDFPVSEQGGGLSGGQRQSIALARALVGEKPILLLDEPTSAMDVHSEKAIVETLRKEGQESTLVVATHRTALLEIVDRVIVLEAGQVVLDGPKELLTKRNARPARRPEVIANAG